MNLDDRIATIDPARGIDDHLVDGERARSTFTRVVGRDLAAAGVESTRRRRPGRYVAAAAAAASAVVFAPVLGGSGTAYAGWTATARPATAAELQSQGTACTRMHSDPGAGDQDHHFTVSLVEVRGEYAYTVLAGDDGFEATCLLPANTRRPGGYGLNGLLRQEPGPRAIVHNSVREDEFEPGHTQYEVTGKVGADVTAVTINAPGVDVHASIQNGRFAAWWPGHSSRSLFGRMMPGPLDPDVTLTYLDGSHHRAPIQTYDVSSM